jgi:FkbM family methyltransferase
MGRILKMIKSLLLLSRRKTWGPFVESAQITKFDHAFTVSWSQGGEDLALLSLFGDKKNGSYLDIGAHHPNRFSVTRHLYQRGWSGVNVDANQALIYEFEKVRTRDINLCCAVGQKDSYEFAIFKEPAISTVNPEWKARFILEKNKVERIETVPGRKLRSIYDDFFGTSTVDLLTIDAEGSDFEVLQSMDFSSLEAKRFPKCLLLETAPPVSKSLTNPSVVFAIELGYEPVYILPMSTILQRKDI